MDSPTPTQSAPHAIGTRGRDVDLVTVNDWQSLVGTTWIDDKQNERKITALIYAYRDGSLISCVVLWIRSHWESDRQPYSSSDFQFRTWLSKATRVS
jgi:hypothetical protein